MGAGQGAAAFAMAAFLAGSVHAGCRLGKIAELAVTMTDLSPLIATKINSGDARFVIDSGAFFSQITPAKAQEFHLRLQPAPSYLTVSEKISLTTVRDFTLADQPLKNVEFIVGGSEPGHDAAGLIGQNVLAMGDVEYDLANGVVRLWETRGCGAANLAYWRSSGAYSVVNIEWPSGADREALADAYLNGVKIRVMFDTGSSTSFISAGAAKRAGLDRHGAGAQEGGRWGGVGRRLVDTWTAPVARFKIGDEEIRTTRMRVGDTDIDGEDMLLGADFFLSHRLFVSNAEHKVFFTYNGGPVFNLGVPPAAQPVPAPVADDKTMASVTPEAEVLARRGNAHLARGENEAAITDLTKAVALAPKDARFAYALGLAYLADDKPPLAMTNFDKALVLDPDLAPALVERASLHAKTGDRAKAVTDLQAAERLSPMVADVRLRLGGIYMEVEAFPAAMAQFDLWTQAHPEDSRLAAALGQRCLASGLSGADLAKGLSACGQSLGLDGADWETHSARGLVRLRLGQFDRSIADFNAALKLSPQNPRALYGRGLAELKTGEAAQGAADIAAARKLDPGLAKQAERLGLAP